MKIEISDRQYEVLQLKIAGLPDKQIADRLHISIRTVKDHAEKLCRAFGITGNMMADLIAKFGTFEVRTVWVPNPKAPTVVVVKSRLTGRDSGRFSNLPRPVRETRGTNLCIDKKRHRPWRAVAKKKFLGYYATEAEAHAAYLQYMEKNNGKHHDQSGS